MVDFNKENVFTFIKTAVILNIKNQQKDERKQKKMKWDI